MCVRVQSSTSSLYQKVKFPYKKFVVNNPWRQPSYKCQRASPYGPSQKWGFNTLWIWVWWGSLPQFFRGRVEYFLMPVTMKNTNDFSGMGIWKKKQGIPEFPDLPTATPPLGLGYKPHWRRPVVVDAIMKGLKPCFSLSSGTPLRAHLYETIYFFFFWIGMKLYTLILNGVTTDGEKNCKLTPILKQFH